MGDTAGKIDEDGKLFKAARSGDPDVLMTRIPVTKAQHDRALAHMRGFAGRGQYNLYQRNCAHAAIRSLQAAGLANFSVQTPLGLPPLPHSVHRGIQIGLPVPSP